MTDAQITILRTELLNDPRGYGYNAAGRNDSNIERIINTVRDGTNPPTNPTADGGTANGLISIKRPTIPRQELLNAIDTRDLKASPTVLEGSILESILQSDTITLLNDDGTNNLTRQNLNRLLNDTQGSQTRLGQIARRPGSRAEEKFGFGVTVTIENVGKALNQ